MNTQQNESEKRLRDIFLDCVENFLFSKNFKPGESNETVNFLKDSLGITETLDNMTDFQIFNVFSSVSQGFPRPNRFKTLIKRIRDILQDKMEIEEEEVLPTESEEIKTPNENEVKNKWFGVMKSQGNVFNVVSMKIPLVISKEITERSLANDTFEDICKNVLLKEKTIYELQTYLLGYARANFVESIIGYNEDLWTQIKDKVFSLIFQACDKSIFFPELLPDIIKFQEKRLKEREIAQKSFQTIVQ